MGWVKTTREANLFLIPILMIVIALTVWIYMMHFTEENPREHICNSQNICVPPEIYFEYLSEGKDFLHSNVKINLDYEDIQ